MRLHKPPPWTPLDYSDSINRGCVGCWLLGPHFGAGAGARSALDSASFRNHGTPTNFPAFPFAPGHHGGMALRFDGVNDIIAVANHPAINNLTTLTLSIWTYRTGNGGGGLGRMLDKRNANADGAFILYNNGFNYLFEAHRWQTANGVWLIALPSANAWHHICVTYDYGATTNDPVFYVDGASVTVTQSGADPSGTLASETETFNIGNNDAATRTWAGSLDHVRVYNRILSAAEISRLYAEPWAGFDQPARLALPTLAGAAALARRHRLLMLGVG